MMQRLACASVLAVAVPVLAIAGAPAPQQEAPAFHSSARHINHVANVEDNAQVEQRARIWALTDAAAALCEGCVIKVSAN